MNSRQHDSSVQTMSVDIRLCGNIPRQEMKKHLLSLPGAPSSLRALTLTSQANTLSTACFTGNNASDHEGPTHRTIALSESLSAVLQNKSNTMTAVQPLSPLVEPPSWAVPARGETRLEPVCESLGRQCAVDLTRRASFRIGRSPNMDVQLMHATSSRRHAMLFHHSNGSCYIIDCGSAHGTYVNGNRISSPSKSGVVVPHRVRRGALIRFGGPGAPCFVLKSFSFKLRDVMARSTETSDMGELIRRNTRINALGKTAGKVLSERVMSTIEAALSVSRKRSFDSLDSRETLGEENSCCKRLCMSPPHSPEALLPVRFVSPELPPLSLIKHRRVTFSKAPPQAFYPALVTPDVLSSEEDNASF